MNLVFNGQLKNKNCSLGAQRAAYGGVTKDGKPHYGRVCVIPHSSTDVENSAQIRRDIKTVSTGSIQNSTLSRNTKAIGYDCSGFSRCLPNPYAFQPEGNILCSVTYNDRSAALNDCIAFECTHLLEYKFHGKSKAKF